MWEMLKNYKRDRIILMTTHYMDEADVLGDRVGIIHEGQMKCLGSSLFLKNSFGAGYRLTLIKSNRLPNRKIQLYLTATFGPKTELMSETATEITFLIPQNRAPLFAAFFARFDREMDSLDIDSYGISITTLEEVFLKITIEDRLKKLDSEEMNR